MEIMGDGPRRVEGCWRLAIRARTQAFFFEPGLGTGDSVCAK